MIIEHDSGPGLSLAKEAKWSEVKALRNEKLAAGFTVPGIGTFQTDERSMANIHEAVSGALLAGATGQPYSVKFTLADNTRPTFTATQIMVAGKLIGERKSAIHSYSQDVLRAAIEAAENYVELEAINIDSGWPT